MSKKVLKILAVFIGVVIILGIIFFTTDYIRINNGKDPIFSLKVGVYRDGGTVEYLGLGYKVIDYNTLDGYDEIKIGTWFIRYEVPKLDDNTIKNPLISQLGYVNLEEIPQNYTIDNAIADGFVVITHNRIYHKDKLDNFIENVNNNQEDSIVIVQPTIEGDIIIKQVIYNKTNYILQVDNTRDRFSAIEDRVIKIDNDIPNQFYKVNLMQDGDTMQFMFSLTAEIHYIDESSKIYEDILICSYPKNIDEEGPSFFGKVIESKSTYIMVEPNEGEEERKSSDKFYISLGENNDALYEVGTNVKITYTGFIRESYPAQIDAINIEIKSVDNFELIFSKENKETSQINKVIEKSEIEGYRYSIYSYGGNVSIKIKNETISLREALLNNKITIDEIIQKANADLTKGSIQGDTYQDGGSMIYKYGTYTIIKCHTLGGNRDVYIGIPEMNINDVIK